MFLQPIHLKGEKYLLKGQIHVELDENVPENVPVDISDDKGNVLDVTTGRLVSSESDQSKNAVYEYSVWANFGEELIFVPRDSRYICCAYCSCFLLPGFLGYVLTSYYDPVTP